MNNSKSIIWVCMVVGSFVGGYVPTFWGGSMISFTSIFLTAVGGILGIYIGFKISNM